MKNIYLVILVFLLNVSTQAQNTSGKTFLQFDIASAIIPPHRVSIGLTHQFSPNFFAAAEIDGNNPIISMDFPNRYEKEGKERTLNINCQIRFFLCF